MTEVQHHPQAAEALAGFDPVRVGKVLTALTKHGLEIGEAGSNVLTFTARAQRDLVVQVVADLLADPSEAHLVTARALLRRPWAVAAIERGREGKRDVWIDQIEATKGSAA